MDEQTNNVKTGDAQYLEPLQTIKAEAQNMKEAILKADFGEFAASMQHGRESKKKKAISITNQMIEEVYNAAMTAGANAGKFSGAGDGGFIMFFADPALRPYVMRVLSKFNGQVSTCNFTDTGTQSWRKS